MTTLNTLTELATILGELAIETTDKGIAIGLQQARSIVLGEAVGHTEDPVEAHKMLHTVMEITTSTVEAQLAYMAEQEQPADSTEKDTVPVNVNGEERFMSPDDIMQAMRKEQEQPKPLFESATSDDFDKALDEFITALESNENPIDKPQVVVLDVNTPEGRRELEKMFSED